MAMWNNITLVLFLGFWPVWLIWEIVLLWRRSKGGAIPGTISMVARDRGWHLNSVVYLWAGLATHYWWPSKDWATVGGSVTFWLMVLALLIQDILLWKSSVSSWPKWLRYQRWPLLWLIIGALFGHFLFPQQGMSP